MASVKAPARRRPRVAPCVLAIGGLDPGAGAGVLADARAIARAGAFACAAVSVLTVQSTDGLRSATPVARREVVAACVEVLQSQRIRAIKVGALGSEDNAETIGDLLAKHRKLPSVVDTVMLPTRGEGRLLEERAVDTLRHRVVRHATLVTVNAPEAAVLSARRVARLEDAHDAALAILALGARAVLLKGGHLTGALAIDLLALRGEDGSRVVPIRAPRLSLPPTHGGGCILASLIAGRLAVWTEAFARDPNGTITRAVRWAKRIHHAALADAVDVGGAMRVLVPA